MSKVMRALGCAFLAVFSVGAISADEIENWTAPPYWSPPAPGQVVKLNEAGIVSPMALETVPSGPLPFFAIAPCRVVDTRPSQGFAGAYGPPIMAANAIRTFDINSGPCPGIPAGAEAYSLNFAVTETTGAPGDIRVFPTGSGVSTTSVLNWNFVGNGAIANAIIIPAGTNGAIDVQVAGFNTHLVIDINGYYAPISIVNTVNGLSGAITLAQGSNISITPSGQTLTIGSTAAGLPAGSANQTLRHNGSSWVASGALTNDGTNVGLTGTLLFPATARAQAGANQILKVVGSDSNTFLGEFAGDAASSGVGNTGIGFKALWKANSSSAFNVAVGSGALQSLTSPIGNVGIGLLALRNLTTGNNNIAIGGDVGPNVTTGNNNIAIGQLAGSNTFAGSHNIYIGASGSADESGQIRIGTVANITQGTVIVGIHGFGSSGGIPVIVNSGGRLGTTTSSARFKEDVRDIARESDDLMKLRPVAFRYRESHEPGGLQQYGLIAEEVARVYPELVVSDGEGRPFAIRSQLLDPLLLAEIQKQRREIEELKARLSKLEEKNAP